MAQGEKFGGDQTSVFQRSLSLMRGGQTWGGAAAGGWRRGRPADTVCLQMCVSVTQLTNDNE